MKYSFLKFLLVINSLAVLICSLGCLGFNSNSSDSERIICIAASVFCFMQSIIYSCLVSVLSDLERITKDYKKNNDIPLPDDTPDDTKE